MCVLVKEVVCVDCVFVMTIHRDMDNIVKSVG